MKLLVIVAGPNGSGKSALISEVCNSPVTVKVYVLKYYAKRLKRKSD